MKRAIRRHHRKVAKIRKINIITRYGASYWGWHGDIWWANSWWKDYSRLCMNEPGWWIREFMTRPARIRSNQQLKLIENGRDPDQFQWPDGKKPHIYYW